MRDISLHLLDLVQNSIAAQAGLVRVQVALDDQSLLRINVEDDGRGMDEATLRQAQTPFYTSRTTRRVGLGLPMAAQSARMSGGGLQVQSTPGQGTRLTLTFDRRSIDCLPLGDLAATFATLIRANPQRPDFELVFSSPRGRQELDTRQLKRQLDGVSLAEPEIAAYILDCLREQTQVVFGGSLA